MFSFLHPCTVLQISACKNKPFRYFYRDVWNEYALKESKAFPLFEDGPHKFYAWLLVYLACLHLVLEPLMKLKAKPFSYRPLLLVFNSFQFTINFIGFLIISCFVTDFGVSLWTCRWHIETSQRDLCLKLGYIFILGKIFELLKPILSILRGFKPQKIDTFNQVIFLMLAYKAFLFYPFGQHIWVIIVDTAYMSLVYMYLIFSCIGTKEMKPTKYKNYLPLLNMFRYSLLFAQSVVTFPDYCPGYYYLKLVGSTYTLFGFIFATIYMVNHLDREQEKRKLLLKEE